MKGLDMILKEKDKRIESLDNDLKKAGQREENLKNMHNNYFLQVQTLINQKAIGTGSTRKEESKQASKKEHDIEHEVKPEVDQEEKPQIEKICKNCLQPFFTENPKKNL
jgi:leucyl-tRNA synthetase